jgi:hypothetical protein
MASRLGSSISPLSSSPSLSLSLLQRATRRFGGIDISDISSIAMINVDGIDISGCGHDSTLN